MECVWAAESVSIDRGGPGLLVYHYIEAGNARKCDFSSGECVWEVLAVCGASGLFSM